MQKKGLNMAKLRFQPGRSAKLVLEPGIPVVIQAWVAVAEHDDGRMKRVTCQAPNEVAALLTLQAENPGRAQASDSCVCVARSTLPPGVASDTLGPSKGRRP